MAEYEAELACLADTAPFDKQTAILAAKCAEAAALVEDCIAANAAIALNQVEYQKRYFELVARYDASKTQLDTLKQSKLERSVRREKVRRFLETLRQADCLLGAKTSLGTDPSHNVNSSRTVNPAPITFDERLWRETVESITVYSLEDVQVRFYSGTEIHVSTKDNAV